MTTHLSSLEREQHWQMTVEDRAGGLIAFMRRHKGGPYEAEYYTM